MLLNALNIIYVLIAIAMTVFILLQRGAGATAGASFGAGASATVFGSRGASSFLTRTTAVLATSFFVLTLFMGVHVSRGSAIAQEIDLGVMGGTTTDSDVPAKPKPALDVPKARAPAPAAKPAITVPSTGAVTVAPAKPVAVLPVAPAGDVPQPPPARTDDNPAR